MDIDWNDPVNRAYMEVITRPYDYGTDSIPKDADGEPPSSEDEDPRFGYTQQRQRQIRAADGDEEAPRRRCRQIILTDSDEEVRWRGKRRGKRRLILPADDEEQEIEQELSLAQRRRVLAQEPRIREHSQVADELGHIPTELLGFPKRNYIPREIKELRSVREKQFSQERFIYCLDIDKTGMETYPVDQEFMEWGRKWIIKNSSIRNGGLGLFACEDINWDEDGDNAVIAVPLFPYVGVFYKQSEYDQLSIHYPRMRRYAIDTGWPGAPPGLYKEAIIVGEARKDRNLAAYMNSSENTGIRPQVQWEWVDNRDLDGHYPPVGVNKKLKKYLQTLQNQETRPAYSMTVATSFIKKGDELFVKYPFMDA